MGDSLTRFPPIGIDFKKFGTSQAYIQKLKKIMPQSITSQKSPHMIDPAMLNFLEISRIEMPKNEMEQELIE